jgi:hypothetical protein
MRQDPHADQGVDGKVVAVAQALPPELFFLGYALSDEPVVAIGLRTITPRQLPSDLLCAAS